MKSIGVQQKFKMSHLVLCLALLSSFEALSGGVTSGSWQSLTASPSPDARRQAFSAWTGEKILVWGGFLYNYVSTNTGGLYDPISNSWTPISTINAPIGRNAQSVIWTGKEMIVWGGDPSESTGTGAIYDPASDSWKTMSTVNAPSGRQWYSMVFTGKELIVFGGRDRFVSLNTGARYDLASDTWQSLSMTNAPEKRHSASVVWTGSKMIVWGGNLATYASSYKLLNDGAIYDPITNTWQAIKPSPSLSPRADAIAVWVEGRMLLFGGWGTYTTNYGWQASPYVNGAYLNPEDGSWTAIRKPAIKANMTYSYAFSGKDLILWSMGTLGFCDIPAVKFNITRGSWSKISTDGAPTACSGTSVTWAGSQMFVFGGSKTETTNESALFAP